MLTVNVNVNVNGRAEFRRQRKWLLPRGCPITVTLTVTLMVNILYRESSFYYAVLVSTFIIFLPVLFWLFWPRKTLAMMMVMTFWQLVLILFLNRPESTKNLNFICEIHLLYCCCCLVPFKYGRSYRKNSNACKFVFTYWGPVSVRFQVFVF